MTPEIRENDGDITAYPAGSKWWRCLVCGHRFFGYPASVLCSQPGCRGTVHADWRPEESA